MACCWLRRRGVTPMLDEGAAEGIDELPQEGCMCWVRFLLSVDGGHHLFPSKRPDLVDREDSGQVRRLGGFARLWGRMTSAYCRPSRLNLHAADHCLVCCQRRWAHLQRQQRAFTGCQLPVLPDTMVVRGSGGCSGGKVVGPHSMGVSLESMGSTASRSQCRASGRGVILTW